MTTTTEPTFDALLPPAMAAKAEQVGVNKANLETLNTFMLAVLAGAFIALSVVFATTVTAGAAGSQDTITINYEIELKNGYPAYPQKESNPSS